MGSKKPFEGLNRRLMYDVKTQTLGMYWFSACLEWVNGLHFSLKLHRDKFQEIGQKCHINYPENPHESKRENCKWHKLSDWGNFIQTFFLGKSIRKLYWTASIIQSQKSHIWPHTKIHSHVLSHLGGVMRTDTWKNVGGLNKGGTLERTHHCDHTLSPASAVSASERIDW